MEQIQCVQPDLRQANLENWGWTAGKARIVPPLQHTYSLTDVVCSPLWTRQSQRKAVNGDSSYTTGRGLQKHVEYTWLGEEIQRKVKKIAAGESTTLPDLILKKDGEFLEFLSFITPNPHLTWIVSVTIILQDKIFGLDIKRLLYSFKLFVCCVHRQTELQVDR